MAFVSIADAMQQDGPLRASRRDKTRIGQIEGIVKRFHAYRPHLVQSGGIFQVDLGVAPAGFHVALSAVSLEILTGAQSQVLLLVVRVQQVGVALRGLC